MQLCPPCLSGRPFVARQRTEGDSKRVDTIARVRRAFHIQVSTAETKPATGRRKTRPVVAVERHGTCARQIAGADHGALARRANPVMDDQVEVSSLRARLWPSR